MNRHVETLNLWVGTPNRRILYRFNERIAQLKFDISAAVSEIERLERLETEISQCRESNDKMNSRLLASEADNVKLRTALERLVGESKREPLERMLAVLKEIDSRASADGKFAIQTLIETLK